VADNLPDGVSPGDVTLRVKLLCGTDLLDSFNTPGVWAPEDIADIVANFGLVCIQREGSDGEKIVFDHDVLYRHRSNIDFVRQLVPHDLSSTRVRQFLARGMSVKYMVLDNVIEYIHANGLYGTNVSSKM
jgi:nicotinamide mononucleotide adenylyltransferase